MTTSKGRARTADAAPQKKHEDPVTTSAGTDVATLLRPGELALPDYLADVTEDYGQGTSAAQEDNIVPLVRIIQKGSPEVNKQKPEYIADAAIGDILMKGFGQAVAPGDGGIVVQPCAFRKIHVEWVPRAKGGGFVAFHDDAPPDARETVDAQTGRKTLTRPNGNEVIETRYHYVLINGNAAVIPFTSTGHTVSRQWNSMMRQVKHKGNVLPSWAKRYHLSTVYRSNDSGDWYTFKVDATEGFVSAEEYAAGKAFAEEVAKGDKVVDAAAERPDAGGESDAADDVI